MGLLRRKRLRSPGHRFLGRNARAVAEVTVAFLRWVLALLYTSLRAAAEAALARVR